MYKDLPAERGKAESEQPVASTDEGRAGERHRMRMTLECEFTHLAFTNSGFFLCHRCKFMWLVLCIKVRIYLGGAKENLYTI